MHFWLFPGRLTALNGRKLLSVELWFSIGFLKDNRISGRHRGG